MGPIWGWQDPGGPHMGSMNFAIWDFMIFFQVRSRNTPVIQTGGIWFCFTSTSMETQDVAVEPGKWKLITVQYLI